MAKHVILRQALVEQILNGLFTILEERDEFDIRTIQREISQIDKTSEKGGTVLLG